MSMKRVLWQFVTYKKWLYFWNVVAWTTRPSSKAGCRPEAPSIRLCSTYRAPASARKPIGHRSSDLGPRTATV